MIYLDNNATTRISPRVANAMADCFAARLANPASSHRLGRDARKQLERARRSLAVALGARLEGYPPDRLIFTSGATEANHLAIRGLSAARPGAVLVSSLEHPSVAGAAQQLQAEGREVAVIRALPTGQVDLQHLATLLEHPTSVVALMLANNETGVIQPVAEAAELCRQARVALHCDAVQAIGKMPVDFRQLNVDTMCLNAHKLHGPVGVGALIVRANVSLTPIMLGGGQQLGTRPGTESVAMAVGFERAVAEWLEDAEGRRSRLTRLRDQLESLLLKEPETVIHGATLGDIGETQIDSEPTPPRIPTTTNVSFLGLNRQELLMALDLEGVACSTGSACASGSSEPSPVLLAMGLGDDAVESSIRLSLGADTTEDEVVVGAERIRAVVRRLRG